MKNLGRVLTAMVTPFKEDMEVDYDQACYLADLLTEKGSDGVVVAGTTGESPTLSKEEKLNLFRKVKERIGNKASVVAGTGSYNTKESIELSRKAAEVGVDAVMLVVPYYNKPSQEGMFQHFKAVASKIDKPVILYNVPSRTGSNLLPETVARLAEIENIIGIKEASGNLEQIVMIRRLTDPEFLIYSGDDALTLPILSAGGNGVISVASHLSGEELQLMVKYFMEGAPEKARMINEKLFPLYKTLFITSNPVPVKTALNILGIRVGGFRLPLVEASEEERAEIIKTLKNMELSIN